MPRRERKNQPYPVYRKTICKRGDATVNRRAVHDTPRPPLFVFPHMDSRKELLKVLRTDGVHIHLPFVATETQPDKAWQTNCHARECKSKATRRCICSVRVPRCEPCFMWHMLTHEGREQWRDPAVDEDSDFDSEDETAVM